VPASRRGAPCIPAVPHVHEPPKPPRHSGLQLLNSDHYTQSDASTLTTEYWISGQYPIGPKRNRLHGHTGAPGSVPVMNHST
jgi:hypothetical protein